MRISAVVVVSLAVVGCDRTPEEDPLAGPGFDEQTGEILGAQQSYVVGITHLQVKNASKPGGRFGDHASAIGNHLFEEEPDGWVGAGFRNVGNLQWWTLTVWENEEALTDFVVSEPHLSAMVDLTDISVGAVSRSMTLQAKELPLSWGRALELLLEQQDYTFGDARWARP